MSHSTLGNPGTLSLNPLSHIAQLSVARDHSPTTCGDIQCTDEGEKTLLEGMRVVVVECIR